MKRLLNYIPLHFCVCVIFGIVCQFYFKIWDFGFLKLGLVFTFLLVALFLLHHKVIRTLLSFVLFIFIGIATVFVDDNRNYTNYYKNHLKSESSAILKVNKVLKSSVYHHKYEVEVTQIDAIKTKGKLLLNITKDSFSNPLNVDDLVFTKEQFVPVNKPGNPYQFDYKHYLAKQGIYEQLYLAKQKYFKLKKETFSLNGLSESFRNKIQKSLSKYNFRTDEYAVINALLLGQRTELSNELSANYSNAGAIHILAVSGLHVGILLWILIWLLKPLERLRKGKLIKLFLIVILLWMFAFIAGLSASVVRAVTMFTFLAIGLFLKRKNVVLFSLITSMFFLLIFKPMFLFDVGFQLSYLAVFGILFIQPKLYGLYNPRFWVDKKVWEITSVSIAAQIGVLPLSLFYFHQFPGLFMLSNIVIIPFLGAILVGGIVIVFFALTGLLPQIIANVYGIVITAMNSFVTWVSQQEQFLFQEISMSFLMLIVVYAIIINGYSLLTEKSAKRLLYFLITLLFVQSIYLFESYQKQSKYEFIVFHKSRKSIIAKRVGNLQKVYHNLDNFQIEKTNALLSYRVQENINQTFIKKIPNVFMIRNQSFLIVDSLGVYQIENLKNPIVILQNSPKINLERLIKTLHPKQIIADGSNYKSYVKRWAKYALKRKTPFHHTGQNGAFIY